jgi:hypothetical protein
MIRRRSFFSILLLLPRLASSQWGGPYCEVDSLPVVLLHRNSTTGEFTVVERISPNETDFDEGEFRFLQADHISTDDSSLRQRITPGVPATESSRITTSTSTRRDLNGSFSLGNDISTPQNENDDNAFDHATDNDDDIVFENATEEYFYARECSCFNPLYPTSYCPFTVEICQQPAPFSRATHPGCLTVQPHRDRAKLLFLAITFWYCVVLAGLLFTKYGRSSFDYVISFLVPGWNRYVLGRIMRNDPHRTRELIRGYVLRQQRRIALLSNETSTETAQGGGGSTQQGTRQTTAPGTAYVETELPVETRKKPTSLALRTRILKKKDHPDSDTTDDPCLSAAHADDADDDDDCTICFAPLLEGDRVGELGCAHVFHVECLKLWLQRKNICPLCQKREVAESRYDDKIATTDQEEVVTDSSSVYQEADNPVFADGTVAQAPQETIPPPSVVEDSNSDDPSHQDISNPGLEEASTQPATEDTQDSPGSGGMAPESR